MEPWGERTRDASRRRRPRLPLIKDVRKTTTSEAPSKKGRLSQWDRMKDSGETVASFSLEPPTRAVILAPFSFKTPANDFWRGEISKTFFCAISGRRGFNSFSSTEKINPRKSSSTMGRPGRVTSSAFFFDEKIFRKPTGDTLH